MRKLERKAHVKALKDTLTIVYMNLLDVERIEIS